MSRKTRRRNVHQTAPVKDKKSFSLKPDHICIIAALILAGLPFCLGKYIEFNTPGPFDSGAYVYSARHILSGARIGVDELPSARPGTLLMNIIGVKLFGFREFGPKLMQGLLQAGGLVMMFIALKKLFGNLPACIGPAIAAFYLSAPVIAKYGNVKEQFMIGYMLIGGSCFILFHTERKWWWLLVSGAFIINAPYCKATGTSIIGGLVIFQLYRLIVNKLPVTDFLRQTGTWLGGAAIGMIPLVILYGWQGQLQRLFPKLLFSVLSFVIIAGGLALLVYSVIIWFVRHNAVKQLKSVNRKIWIGGCAALAITLVFSVIYVKIRTSSIFTKAGIEHEGQVMSYLMETPYATVPPIIKAHITRAFNEVLSRAGMEKGYLSQTRSVVSLSTQAPRIMRYYKTLCVPVIFGIAAALLGIVQFISRLPGKAETKLQDKMLIFLVTWWILDMAFVWISARPYEQYYLPLNASAAMLSGYVVWLYSRGMSKSRSPGTWIGGGIAAAVLMVILSRHIFFGLNYSPYSGVKYKAPTNGYVQRLEFISNMKKGGKLDWQKIGEYIRANSNEDDRIYVWGWYPGIYVQARRLSCIPKAFESDMHVTPPLQLKNNIEKMVDIFRKSPPEFIVDTRKIHFPNDRPALEFWPQTQKGPLSKSDLPQYEKIYRNMLSEKIDEQEALRFDALKPMRHFVMDNYRIVGKYNPHVLLQYTGSN